MLPPEQIQIIGESQVFLDLMDRVSEVAPMERPVLVIGERGTGKELIAARLHFLSRRWDRPFIKTNCAAIPDTLIESELFGYEAGAFTGATRQRAGRFEQADGGTLFLDEIANMTLAAQEKMLRVIASAATRPCRSTSASSAPRMWTFRPPPRRGAFASTSWTALRSTS